MPTMPMIVCPTTHDDWDWQDTFETYYQTAPNQIGVRGILDSVVAIFAGTSSADQQFCFSYAEVGFLRRYLEDTQTTQPNKLAALRGAGARFCLLGGGITSPDNLVCDYEVFIRNYLTGHAFLRSVGLIDQVSMIGWIPDDFGHSPQLPILFEAMGMKTAGLSRIPGSPQPTLCPSCQPADATVRAQGITFNWVARDGSRLVTQFMPNTYYGIYQQSLTTVQQMASFVGAFGGDAWPGDIIFATLGGDWQYPQSSAVRSVSGYAYDWQPILTTPTVSKNGYTAAPRMGTVADYFAQLAQARAPVAATTLYAENYYTGHYASRPQLKIDHYHASRQLVGAEVLASLFAMYGRQVPEQGNPLPGAIEDGWHLLVPTSHHDFVTGTSPDNIYGAATRSAAGAPAATDPRVAPEAIWDANGQAAMSARTVELADHALALGMTMLADAVAVAAPAGETAVLVFNQLGCDLPATAMVELADPSAGATAYQVRVDGMLAPVQRTADGTLVFQVPGMAAMTYRVVHLVPNGPASALPPVTTPTSFSNGRTEVTLSPDDAWAISQLTVDGTQRMPNGGLLNQLQTWTDGGNLYQFGMEFMDSCTHGTFTTENSPWGFTAGAGQLTENGPVRWRFDASLDLRNSLTNQALRFTLRYELVAGESLVRITAEGAAPSGTSVLTASMITQVQPIAAPRLQYGTAYHWEDRVPQESWYPTFRASHDFAVLADDNGPIFAVYHNGIPAWTYDAQTPAVLGCLLRNTPGYQRAACGHDNDPHVQRYTIDAGPGLQLADTGYPVRTAQYAHTRLHALALTAPGTGGMPSRAQLARVTPDIALISVAKPAEPPPTGTQAIVLRIQRATDTSQLLVIDLPFLASRALVGAQIVTALETPDDHAPAPAVSGSKVSVTAARAVTSLRIAVAD